MYMLVDRFIQLTHRYLNLVPSRFKLLLKSCKDINIQVLIKFRRKCSKQEVVRYIKRHKLVNSIWNKEGFPPQWKESIYPFCTYL
jgi:hypothetical protein